MSTPHIRSKSTGKLFSKLHAWNEGLEDAVGLVENRTAPVLRRLSASPCPQAAIGKLFYGVEPLDGLATPAEIEILKRYYLVQIMLLHIARTGRDENTELITEKLTHIIDVKTEALFFRNAWIVHLNSEEAMRTPLVLTDNLLTLWAIFEKYESDDRRINAYAPLTENILLFWGDLDDLVLFAQRHPTIDWINRERIRESGKLCKFASSNKRYLEELAISWSYIHTGKSTGLAIELL